MKFSDAELRRILVGLENISESGSASYDKITESAKKKIKAIL